MSVRKKPAQEGLKREMPSMWLLKYALPRLKMEQFEQQATWMGQKADEWHIRHCPGKPSATMAAFLYASLPMLKQGENSVRRNLREIAEAFAIDKGTLAKRLKQIKKED